MVAVEDRSTDHTGDILAGLASVWPDRMRVLRVERLPEGWMGKNHTRVGISRLVEGGATTSAGRCSQKTG